MFVGKCLNIIYVAILSFVLTTLKLLGSDVSW